MKKVIVLTSFLALFITSCRDSTSRQIAFVSNRDGNYEIYVMDSNGSSLENVSNNSGEDSNPSWSPDGNLLAFTSSADGIKVVDINSRTLIFSSDKPSDSQFSWAPDSAQITFHSLRNRDNRWEIFSVKINDITEPKQLTSDNTLDNACAVWSPDGKYIAFTSGESMYVTLSVGDLFLMQSDGSSIEWLAESTGKNWSECPYFSWSPDSQQIAMSDLTDMVIVNITNGLETFLIEDYCPIGIPTWSPSGNSIAFVSDFCTESPKAEIFILDLATENITQLTDNTSANYLPVWSPDGKQMLFVSTRDGNEEIYLMQIDGSNQVNLTNNPASDSLPSWQP